MKSRHLIYLDTVSSGIDFANKLGGPSNSVCEKETVKPLISVRLDTLSMIVGAGFLILTSDELNRNSNVNLGLWIYI